MKLGAISNSWKLQLASSDLKKLVADARSRGAVHVEFRQTFMGDYETGTGDAWRPATEKLAQLVKGFSGLTFNLAIEWPCLSKGSSPKSEAFQAALQASRVLDPHVPQLRLVDRTPFDTAWTQEGQVPVVAIEQTAALTREAYQQGVVLSIENVGQTIAAMNLLVRMVRSRIGEETGRYLGICPDPANQLPSFPESDPVAEIEATPLDFLKIVHFKQLRRGKLHPTIESGDVDCLRQMRVLKKIGYHGAIVMEIPPHDRAMENLASSFAYLKEEMQKP